MVHVYSVESGGRLLDFIVEHYSYSYNEAVASSFLRQVVEALQYLHLNTIAHLDLKVPYYNCFLRIAYILLNV